MALIFNGITECKLCNCKITDKDSIVAFPAFIVNECDPLFMFNDSVFHESCLLKHRSSDEILQRLRKYSHATGPGKRKCLVCKSEIKNPDDYLFIDYLTSDERKFLYKYNYTHLHKSHIDKWVDREEVIEELVRLNDSENWSGKYILRLLLELE